MRAKSLALGLCLLAASAAFCLYSAQADESKPDDLPLQLVQEIVDKLKADDIDGVFAIAKKYTILPENEASVIDQVAQQCKFSREAMIAKFGKPLGEVELVRTESLGKSLVRYVYLEKCERLAMTWQIDFYRGKDGWWIPQFSYQDNPLLQYPATQLTTARY